MHKSTGIILFFLIITNYQVKADSWDIPKINYYSSENKVYVLKVFPTKIPEKYYEWYSVKPNKKKNYKEKDTTIIHCHAVLYKKTANDSIIIWQRNLINKMCPVKVYISNDGKYIVTFDNWSSLGYGLDVMVVYNDLGDLITRFKLEDISPFPINDYEMSISSLWWNCGNRFLDNVTIEICFNTKKTNKHRIFNVKELKFKD